MDETYDLTDEPTPSKPTSEPAKRPAAPAPLPRLRYTAKPDDPPAEPPPQVKKPPAERKSKPVKGETPDAMASRGEGDRKGALLEQTPELDTVETRNKLRIVVGMAALGVLVMIGWLIAKAIPSNEPESADGEVVIFTPPPTAAPRTHLEGEARLALADARGFAKRGDAENTMKRLHKILETYPKSAAAKEAQAAIERAEQGLPVFPDGTLVIARNIAVEEPAPEPVVEVAATTPQASLPVGPAVVSVQPPPTPPDLYRPLALPLEHGNGAANALPPGFRAREQVGVHPSGWPWEITCDLDGAAMRFIPTGEFRMGRDNGSLQERPSHKVALGGYYIDQHETTIRQYARFQGAEGQATRPPSASSEPGSPSSEDSPVTGITWRDANAYLKWCGKQMPTEAQWEAAARTVDGRLYPWGPGTPPWAEPRGSRPLEPVMSQPLDMSPYGVFDLAGNATEWTADFYDPRYFQQFKETLAVEPTGPERLRSKIPTRVVKGGSKTWECSWRDGVRPESRSATIGFRGVLPVEKADAPAPSAPTTPTGPSTPQGIAKGFRPF